MANKGLAAETCRRLALQTQGLLDAAELLESAEVSESYLTGLASETVTKKAELDQTVQLLERTREELIKVQAAGVEELRATDLAASKILSDGKARADQLLADARQQAALALEAAMQEQTDKINRLNAELADATANLQDIKQRTQEAADAERTATDKAKAAAAALAAIQEQAQKMAQKMNSL